MKPISEIIADIRSGVQGTFDMSSHEQAMLLALCDSHEQLTKEVAELKACLLSNDVDAGAQVAALADERDRLKLEAEHQKQLWEGATDNNEFLRRENDQLRDRLKAEVEDNERWQIEVLGDFRIAFDNHRVGRRLAFTQWMCDRNAEVARLQKELTRAEIFAAAMLAKSNDSLKEVARLNGIIADYQTAIRRMLT